MPVWFLVLFFILLAVGIVYAIVTNRRPQQITDERLAYYRSYLVKPKAKKTNGDGTARTSKAFKKTTAPLPEGAEDAIKKIFTPQMLAQFEEGYTALLHGIGARAIELEQVLRKQARLKPGETLTAEDVAVLVNEGLRAEVKEPEALELKLKREEVKPAEHIRFPHERAIYE